MELLSNRFQCFCDSLPFLETGKKYWFFCRLSNFFSNMFYSLFMLYYRALSLRRYRFVLESVGSVLQNSPPNSLNLYHRIMKHPHVIDVLQLKLQDFQVVLFCMLSWLPFFKIVWYKFVFPLWYEKWISLLNKNYPVVNNFKIEKPIDHKMDGFWVLLQRIVFKAENLKTFHPENCFNCLKSIQFVGL